MALHSVPSGAGESGGRPKGGTASPLVGIDRAIARTGLPEASLALLGLQELRILLRNAPLECMGKKTTQRVERGDLVAASIASSHALVRFRGLQHGGCNVAACALSTVAACAATGGAVILGSTPECVADAAETARVTLMRALLDCSETAKIAAISGAGTPLMPPSSEPASDVPDAAIKGDETLGLVGASPSAAAAASGPWLGSQLSRDGADQLLHSLFCLCFVEAENRSLPSMDSWAAQVRDDASLAVCVALALSVSVPVHSRSAPDELPSTLRKRPTARIAKSAEVGLAAESVSKSGQSGRPSWAEPVRAACRANRKQLEQCAAVLGLMPHDDMLASPSAVLDHFASLRKRSGSSTSMPASASQLGLPFTPPALPVLACMPLRAATATDRNVAARWVFGRLSYRINTVTATILAVAVLFWASGAAAALDMYVLGSASLARRAVLSGCQVLIPEQLEPACGGLSVAVFTAWMLLLAAGFAAGGSLVCGSWLGGLMSPVPYDTHHVVAIAALEAVVSTRPTRLLAARSGAASPARPPSLRMVMPPYGANVAALTGAADAEIDEADATGMEASGPALPSFEAAASSSSSPDEDSSAATAGAASSSATPDEGASSLPVPLPLEMLPFLRDTLKAMEDGGLGDKDEAARLRESIGWVEAQLPATGEALATDEALATGEALATAK